MPVKKARRERAESMPMVTSEDEEEEDEGHGDRW